MIWIGLLAGFGLGALLSAAAVFWFIFGDDFE